MIVFLALAAAALAADLLSKHYVFQAFLSQDGLAETVNELRAFRQQRDLPPLTPDQVLHSLAETVAPGVDIRLSTNPGVVFGLPLPPALVIVVSILAAVLITGYVAFCRADAHWLHAALALILAGALGNLYDRALVAVSVPGFETPIRREVRDFIDCSDWGWPAIFNIADVFLVLGVVMMLIQAVREARASAAAKKNG